MVLMLCIVNLIKIKRVFRLVNMSLANKDPSYFIGDQIEPEIEREKDRERDIDKIMKCARSDNNVCALS